MAPDVIIGVDLITKTVRNCAIELAISGSNNAVVLSAIVTFCE